MTWVDAGAATGRGANVQKKRNFGAAGIAPGQSLTLDELIERADEALYRAKSDGRDRVFISDSETVPASGLPIAAEYIARPV